MAKKIEAIRLGDLVKITSGGTPSKEIKTNWGGDMPWISASSMKQKLLNNSALKLTEQGINNGGRLAETGDVLLLVRGSELHNSIPVGIATRRVAYNQDIKALRCSNAICSEFLYYWLKAMESDLLSKVESTGIGAGKIDTEILKGLKILLPERELQAVIASQFKALDDKIELNRQMNETLEQMAKALFKSWFVDFDPVHAKAAGRQPAGMDKATADLFPDSFADSELGKIPKGWRIGALGEIATNPRRGMQPEDIAPGTPYIGLEHMPRRSIALGEWEDSIVVESGKSGFKKGEILFGKLRPYFHKVGIAPMDGVCSTDILVLAPVSQAWFGPLLSYASSDELIQFTNLASTGTKMPRTNWRDVSSFKIIIPTHELADGYSKIISSLTAKIAQNLSQSKTLSATRDALLPRLIGDRQFIEARK